MGICSEGEIPVYGGGWGAGDGGGEDDDYGLRLRDLFGLITPRLFLAGGVNVVGCMAFGVVQPMLSLYLSRSPLDYDERDIGWGQFCVTLGYMMGIWRGPPTIHNTRTTIMFYGALTPPSVSSRSPPPQ